MKFESKIAGKRGCIRRSKKGPKKDKVKKEPSVRRKKDAKFLKITQTKLLTLNKIRRLSETIFFFDLNNKLLNKLNKYFFK